MRFMTPLRRLATAAAYRKRGFSRGWSQILAGLDVYPFEHGRPIGGGVAIGDLVLDQPRDLAKAVIQKYRVVHDLQRRAGAKFAITDSIRIEVDGVSAVAEHANDINVFHEVFVERLYAMDDFQGVVIDAGANIGLSGLYFARHYNVDVIAYELVPSTADLAQRNIDSNPGLRDRIKLKPFGLAAKSGEFEVQTDPAMRASHGLGFQLEGGKAENVKVLSAVDEVRAIHAENEGQPLLLKLDIEGAEYEVLESLAADQCLGLFSRIIIEWHTVEGHAPSEILALLKAAGFAWFEYAHHSEPVGMITAWKN